MRESQFIDESFDIDKKTFENLSMIYRYLLLYTKDTWIIIFIIWVKQAFGAPDGKFSSFCKLIIPAVYHVVD